MSTIMAEGAIGRKHFYYAVLVVAHSNGQVSVKGDGGGRAGPGSPFTDGDPCGDAVNDELQGARERCYFAAVASTQRWLSV
jgi:hypothetical protein